MTASTIERQPGGRPAIHVSRGVNRRYLARVRMAGWRKWHVLPTRHLTSTRAARRLADALSTGRWERGEVLMTADCYEPVLVIEMRRA